MLRTACTAMLLLVVGALAGCSPDARANRKPTAVLTQAPARLAAGSPDAKALGAYVYGRCKRGFERSGKLAALPPTAEGLLLGRPDDRWLACVDAPGVTGSAKVPCSTGHTWRAVTTIVLGRPADPYPGDRLSEVRTRDYCSDSVGAWLNYPVDYDFGFAWFHAAEWRAGNRRAICWARTAQ